MVPRTKTYRQFKEEKAQQDTASKKMQRGPDGMPNGVNGDSSNTSIGQMFEQQRQQPTMKDTITNGDHSAERPHQTTAIAGSPIVDRTLHGSPHGHPDPVRDIEMDN